MGTCPAKPYKNFYLMICFDQIWVLRSKFYTNEIPLSFFSQLFNLCFRVSNTNLNISKRQANLLKPNRRTLDNSLWLNHLHTHLFITGSEQLQCIQAIFQDRKFPKDKNLKNLTSSSTQFHKCSVKTRQIKRTYGAELRL